MGAIGHDGLAVPGKVVLAHEPSFRLGPVQVCPATRELLSPSKRETIEPRVMQVLVALARANGRVVTRDELIQSCWDGRVVGEDAINRVIARIRQIGTGLGASGFAVETITKVGYRLIVGMDEGRPVPPDNIEPAFKPAPRPSRRALLVGAGATAAGAGLLWWSPWRHRPPEQARELVRRADIAWKAGLDDQARQAVYFLERAVQIDPQYGEAWGALAVAYTHLLEGYGEAEMASVPDRIRSAAAKAIELDPGNGDARLALACIKPAFRNWLTMESQLRTLSDQHPSLWLAHGRLAFVMYQVGRWEEGIRLHRRVLEIDPMIALPYATIALALSNLGRVQEADAVLDDARRRWPAHPMIWNARYFHLLFSGRPQAAMATLIDPDSRPSGTGAKQIEKRMRLARAAQSGNAQEIEAVVEEHRQATLAEPGAAPFTAQVFALFGRFDLALDSLERYLLDQGASGSSATGSYVRRYTDVLFSRNLLKGRGDPRFAAILRNVGLEHYWEASRTVPDFRRR